MKVWIDCEFYEFHPHHGQLTRDGMAYDVADGGNAVQLISIGAVREDGAEFYAENANFNWDHVPDDHWLQDNVRPHLWQGNSKPLWLLTEGRAPKGGLYTPQDIAQRFWEFACTYALHPSGVATPENVRPEFWGYFCDYDWVAICGLYGRMIDLPSEFPMYCLDLKQEMHRLGWSRSMLNDVVDVEANHHALSDARWVKAAYEQVVGAGE